MTYPAGADAPLLLDPESPHSCACTPAEDPKGLMAEEARDKALRPRRSHTWEEPQGEDPLGAGVGGHAMWRGGHHGPLPMPNQGRCAEWQSPPQSQGATGGGAWASAATTPLAA